MPLSGKSQGISIADLRKHNLLALFFGIMILFLPWRLKREGENEEQSKFIGKS